MPVCSRMENLVRAATAAGMPRSCAEAGVLQRVVSLTQIPGEILQATRYHERAHKASV